MQILLGFFSNNNKRETDTCVTEKDKEKRVKLSESGEKENLDPKKLQTAVSSWSRGNLIVYVVNRFAEYLSKRFSSGVCSRFKTG